MGSQGLVKPYSPALNLVMRLVDAGLIAATHFLAIFIHHETWRDMHTTATVLAVVIMHLVAQWLGLYSAWRGRAITPETARVFLAWMITWAVLLMLAFVSKVSENYSRAISLTWFGGAAVAISIWRACLRLTLRELRRRGRNTRSVAIAGLTELAERVGRTVHEEPELGMRIVGFYDDRIPQRCHPIPEDLGPYKGKLDKLVERARNGEVDIIYIALPLRAEPRINQLVRKLADTTASVYMAADFDAFDLLHARWGSLGDVPVVSIHETPFYGVDGWLKRAEDIVVGTLIMMLISIPMLFIAIGVKLSSKGPVFFRQRRYGLNGEVIHVLKFRSMKVMEDGAEVKQATKNDSRITPFGAFIRRTSLDELPQFIHVITGHMSIVGPRPHAVAHNEAYRKRIQGYMLRHKVKPGITGWAQVNGWRGETDTLEKMEKRIEHDLEYIRNWGLLWDIKIIFLTVFGSKVRKNAY